MMDMFNSMYEKRENSRNCGEITDLATLSVFNCKNQYFLGFLNKFLDLFSAVWKYFNNFCIFIVCIILPAASRLNIPTLAQHFPLLYLS